MPDASEIISRVRSFGANVALDGARLVVINRGKLPPEAFEYLKTHGRLIANHLARQADFEERAAIIEHDAGLSQPHAEDLAAILHGAPPEGCDSADWTWFVTKAAEIIDARRRPA